MLKKIEIQNYAIIERLEISFPAGLTIITGETGAGKSILLGALGLIMGKRADTKVLYDQDRKCYVEATFDVQNYKLQDLFDTLGLDYMAELMIRREIAPGGKSRAFVNDTPVTLDVLQTLTDEIIDIHQQFDTLDIQKPSFQLQMIDALAGNKTLLERYTSKYQTYRHTIKRLEERKQQNRNAHQEIEFLTFQMNEFSEADLRENEQTELEILLHKLTSAEEIKKSTALVAHALEEDENAIIGQLQFFINQMNGIRQLDQKYNDIHDRLISVKEELYDIAKESSRISESTEYDEEAIHNANTRLNIINRLQKKHGVHTMQDLLQLASQIQTKLESYADLSEEIGLLTKQCTEMEVDLRLLAEELSKNRKNVLRHFEDNVHELLVSLSMDHAYIRVKTVPLNELSPSGLDDINMLFAPNKGSEFLPLKDTASGGEMSRLTLCVKSLVAGAVTLPTLIFDEIDAGVSGDVAQKMGNILHQLSKKHQVICITHSPQIAAKAQSHYWVYKTDNEQRTVTAMRELSLDDRITEIAKMLSGNPPTEAARANARELIGL